MHRTAAFLALTLAALAVTARGDGPKWALATRLYADRTARRVGDVLTVLIIEEATSSKDNEKTTDKQYQFNGSAQVGSPLVDGRSPWGWTNASVPAWSLDTKRSFSGKGTMDNKDQLSAKVAVCVTEVLPNGNLLIEGKRTLVVQEEQLEMVLTGIVRPEDVTGDNTVESTRVADASITYHSTGTIAKNQNAGLISRLVDWINPF